MATPIGLFKVAAVAAPPSAVYPDTPILPATVVIIPIEFTFPKQNPLSAHKTSLPLLFHLSNAIVTTIRNEKIAKRRQ